ncbi:MAG: prolipoprotein diacylglyceryl transferase family protein [Dehalococcoidia bacterium]|nr:prolipoprotein diacylglyceryl transferase family protein [Dehalococcoidia bacterium]
MELLLLLPLLVIDINIDPVMADLGPFTLTWHGFFTAVGILAGVSLSVWLGKKDGIPTEVGQEIALVGVPCAIVGARLFYVFEHWDRFFPGNMLDIVFGITEGGITLYGGLIGGVVGGVVYGIIQKWPIGIGLDAAAPGMVLGQGIGRLGDLINGEHLATESNLPWAVRYVHPDTLGELGVAVHPTAGGYEMLGDLVICALLVLVIRRFVKVPGWAFCSYVVLYSGMRFFLSYYRLDEQTIGDVPVPQLTAVVLIGLAVIAAGILYRFPGPITEEWARRHWGDRVVDEGLLDDDGSSGRPAAAKE